MAETDERSAPLHVVKGVRMSLWQSTCFGVLLLSTQALTAERHPVPKGARIRLELDRKAYFLGENILLHFVVENAETEPFELEYGGDYRGATRHLRFKVTATGPDGGKVRDPDPSGFNFGGMGGSKSLKPGEEWIQSLPLHRYLRFESPGLYTIRASHDLGWKETEEARIPWGETRIELAMPTPDQARRIVESAYRARDTRTSIGKRSKPFRDFSCLGYPIYLPILAERARGGDEQALTGLGAIPTPDATKSLIELLRHADGAFAYTAARHVAVRLPDPQITRKLKGRNPFFNPRIEARRWLVEASWRPELAPNVKTFGRQQLAKEDLDRIALGAYILQCLGDERDVPLLVRTLDGAISRAEELPLEESLYPRPRGSCGELMRVVDILIQRGVTAPHEPSSPGEAALFLVAVHHRADFRPPKWQETYARLLADEFGYVRELTLKYAPTPPPAAVRSRLAVLLADPVVDVQIEACRMAKRLGDPSFGKAVLKTLAKARETWLFRSAANAALEIGDRLEVARVLASRLDEDGMLEHCIGYLENLVVDHSGGTSLSDHASRERLKRLKTRWTEFLNEHADDVKAGKLFRIGDPTLTPDLFESACYFNLSGGRTWPKRSCD